MIIFKIASNMKYIPKIVFSIKNWLLFCLNYGGLSNKKDNIYYFRNGMKLATEERIDTSTIAVVFIKKNYGDIPNNSIIVDIGANIGAFSIYATFMSKNSVVYSYEPMVENYELFVKNIKMNNLEKVIHPYNLGIFSKKERKKLFLNDTLSHSMVANVCNKKYVEVDCIALKDIFESNSIKYIDLLKIDCEGAEFEILYNTPDEYFSKIREIRMEYHNQNNGKDNIRELTNFLKQKGKTVFYVNSNKDYSGNIWFR